MTPQSDGGANPHLGCVRLRLRGGSTVDGKDKAGPDLPEPDLPRPRVAKGPGERGICFSNVTIQVPFRPSDRMADSLIIFS